MPKVAKGLIIADPWIGYILEGLKTWEMRSRATSHRGWFGLIRKGSGAVQGVARIVDVGAPLTPRQLLETADKHRIPAEMIRSGAILKWTTPWKLADIRQLKVPVPYRHKSGAVTWVDLAPEVSDAIEAQLSEAAMEPAAPAPSRGDGSWAPAGTAPLVGQVRLTEGNIKNNHIYLRSFFDGFPADAVGGSNRLEKADREVVIDWGGPEAVVTDLDGTKCIFRSRAWVGPFFEANDAKAGDWVAVVETAPYRYRVILSKQ